MIKFNLKFRRITAIIIAMFGLATLSFNCAPSLFESQNYESVGTQSTGPDLFSSQKTSPWVLQNTFQVFSSFANVTGQNMAISNNQLAEYDIRTGALSQTDKLAEISAPLQLAATSLAGEFCNGLITKEQVAGATRKYFNGVNFGAALSANTPATYATVVEAMAQGFWGRSVNADETTILTSYYTDFVAGAGTQVAQTKNLYLATCSAMLASFDSITY